MKQWVNLYCERSTAESRLKVKLHVRLIYEAQITLPSRGVTNDFSVIGLLMGEEKIH